MKVLISPGFGAGWSTWNHPLMAFDKDVIELFERGGSEDEIRRLCADKGYGGIVVPITRWRLEYYEID